MNRIAEASPRLLAGITGAVYALVFVWGGVALGVRGSLGMVAGLIAGALYIVVTLLFYLLFRPVQPRLSLVAALLSLAGCAYGPLSLLHLVPFHVNNLVFFGFYCLMIAYLILRSTFLPRFLGVLMVFAGLGWLTFLSPPLASRLSPYNFVPGLLGEGALTLWLLVAGVNVQRWREQAVTARVRPTRGAN